MLIRGNYVNSFLGNVIILDHLETPENLEVADVFREYKIETLLRNGLKSAYISFRTWNQCSKILFLIQAIQF